MQSFGTSKITLTPKEKEIFDLFQQFVKAKNLNTTLRVSGGWVRDKLLGMESHDIDLALDNMMGADFVQKMNEFLTQGGTEKASGFGVTKFNPDKSKHLETACVKIRDVWIDVVNLRGETYAENSRIPTMSFGTPLEDAERRDLTINSLFFNINEETVEDFTGKGINDLKQGIIRTPLEPVRTFLDDPLRVLRTFRFAARFGYQIVPEIYEALQVQSVKESLKLKVSRERVGIELTSMLHNQNVFKALVEFYRNGLWDVIFLIPDNSTCPDRNQTNSQSFQICERINQELKRADNFYVLKARINESLLTYFAYLSAICYPFHRFTYQQGKNHQPVSSYIMLESLKLPKKETQQVQNIIESALKFRFFDNFEEQFDQIVSWIQETGFFWELSLLLWYTSSNENAKFPEEFRKFIYDRQLETFFDEKPLLNGGEVTSLLGIPPGPGIKSVLNKVLLYQAQDRKITKELLVLKLKEQN